MFFEFFDDVDYVVFVKVFCGLEFVVVISGFGEMIVNILLILDLSYF